MINQVPEGRARERVMVPAPTTDTRARIVEAARRLFHEQGYHATGISTILREAKVHSGSLYHFFESKEALLIGVLEWYVDNLGTQIMDPVEAATDDPIERVFALLAQYRMWWEMAGCAIGCPLGDLALEIGNELPRARELVDLNFRNWSLRVEGWLEAAGPRLPADIDRSALADTVLTTMEGGTMLCRAAGHLEPYDRAVSQLRAYFDHLERAAG